LALETESKQLVCRKCGAVLRMKPGWLIRVGVPTGLLAQVAVRHLGHHGRGFRLAIFTLLAVVGPLVVYALSAPAEKAGEDRRAG
jgi:hypothetical protein